MRTLLIRWNPKAYGDTGKPYNKEYQFSTQAEADAFIKHMEVCYPEEGSFKVLDTEVSNA